MKLLNYLLDLWYCLFRSAYFAEFEEARELQVAYGIQGAHSTLVSCEFCKGFHLRGKQQ